MRKMLILGALLGAALILFQGTAGAQTPVPAATPTPQVIVVTATPSAPPSAWDSFLGEHGKTIIGALIGLIFGGILVWVLKPAFERLGNALAVWLSQRSAGWGFRRRYLTHLIEEYRALNIRGLKTRAPVTVELEQVYVSLHAQVPDQALGRPDPPALDVRTALAQYPRLAILGGPGAGKTTLLAYLTLTYARGQVRDRLGLKEQRLPILVPLRRLKEVLAGGDKGTLPAYLTTWYTELGLRPRPDFFQQKLEAGHCLVLLDGLDEVADEAERVNMARWVDTLVTVYPRNRYIVTSRPPGYESAPLENGFTVLHVRDFTADEIRQFAEHWCLAVELAAQGEDNATARRRATDAARDLVAAIEANPAIRKLAVNPLLLSIIALVHRYRATLPKRRVDLYAECVDVLLGHWDEAKGLAGRLSPGQKRAVLQPLALAMHRAERRDISRADLVKYVARLLPAVGGQDSDAPGFLDEVRERSGLLVEAGLDLYAFTHLTYQEYLCARELVDQEAQRELLLEHVGDEWWQEVTLLYAGMTDATAIVQALLAGQDDADCARLLLAGRCVAEAVRIDEPVRAEVTRRLEATFATCTGDAFLRTGEVLAELAGEDGVDFFLWLAHDDAARRATALWAVGQMGRQPHEALRERVLDRLLAHFRTEALWGEAGAALVAVWGAQTLAELSQREFSAFMLQRGAEVMAVVDGRLLLEALPDADKVAWDILTEALMVEVPAGEFLMGDEKRKVHVDAFRIDKYPVANLQYKRFVDTTGRQPPRHWRDGAYPADQALHPVVYVTWHDAVAYAQWAGKRLPTEEEWERAARGADGRVYPWGDEFDKTRCNTSESSIRGTTSVGQYSPAGDSPYGCADMAGNVWEWTATEEENRWVLRGGPWGLDHDFARCTARHKDLPNLSVNYVGFRCVGATHSLETAP
ncbi:MAG: SUMF1/EgtB/PvdO family nonheme iron enzyme [Chloroflexi bacterium]|nr:SUMF1/EgtB/PvdO family nonheme iron enzyme [Chloroflexota bacterium]MBU1751467.1 SUMF1/EgtB/PvdO family nonheme iron enzyme [Chloroflexota bacterium]